MAETAKTPRPLRSEMTALERRAAHQLAHCTFLPASWPNRFARDMAGIASGAGLITERQRAALWSQVWNYRRQIRDRDLLVMAEAFHDLSLAATAT